MEDRVQLKQEEVVDNEIVLKDINPKSSTKSIDDSATGASLNETLDRMWNAINNKLSRIVNSVNGRTGVVVLTSSDVGLGDVNNVSFADIKQWVIDRLIDEFGNKRIKLLNSFDDLDDILIKNDKKDRNSAYFIEKLNNVDTRSYIGYIYLDESADKLSYMQMPINTIGKTDDSIIYNEKVGNVDMMYGGIAVNISSYEDALKLYEKAGTKEEAGLYIDKTKIINSFYFFDCIYGISSDNYKSGLIYYENIPSDAKPIKFFMNDVEISTDYALNSEYNNLKIGDLILCNFKPYQTTAGTIPDGMDVKLMQRLSCIGIVSDIPSSISGNKYYIVKFHSVKPQLGWGLKYLENHEFGYSTSTPDLRDSEVTHKLIKARIGKTGTDDKAISNLSGLQVYASPNDINPNTNQSTTIPSELLYTTLPTGISSTSKNFKGGIGIMPDASMCVMPYNMYGQYPADNPNGSALIDNWWIPLGDRKNSTDDTSTNYEGSFEQSSIENGTLEDTCLLGININKAVEETNRVVDNGNMISSKFSNLSGLHVVRSHTVLEPQSIGFKGTASAGDTTTSLGETTNGPAFGKTLMSGGLAVNVGKFLDISPNGYPTKASSFHDGESGKVNVRIGKGLTDDGNNFISINTGDGTELDSEGKLKIKAENPFHIKHINVLNVGSAGIGVIIANNKGLFDEQLTTGSHSIAIKIKETYVDEQPNNIHEGLFFDSDGYLRCPINNNKGLSMDTSAVPSADSTGLYIKAGRGLTFYNGKHEQGTDPEVGSLEVDPVALVELIKNDSTALAALKSALGLV